MKGKGYVGDFYASACRTCAHRSQDSRWPKLCSLPVEEWASELFAHDGRVYCGLYQPNDVKGPVGSLHGLDCDQCKHDGWVDSPDRPCPIGGPAILVDPETPTTIWCAAYEERTSCETRGGDGVD